MTTYNSYEAAKIAMPQACICVYKNDGKDVFTGMPSREGTTLFDGAKFAEPADHCMTVEKFLADGHKFVEGDVVLNMHEVLTLTESKVWNFNRKDKLDRNRYILRAAALETKEPKRTKESTAIDTLERLVYEWNGGELWKPPIGEVPSYLLPKRTKVEYVKVEYSYAWEIIKLYEDGVELFKTDSDELQIKRINSIALRAQSGYPFYRRIETEIEWYEDLVEFINQSTGDSRSASANRETLHVRASMSRDKWCDFARILLEQGE